MKNKGVFLLLVMGSVGILSAHDFATHIHVGSRTPEVWRDFDPEFYSWLTGPENDFWPVIVRKFYDIGLTLPDMFLTESESTGDFGMQELLRTMVMKIDSIKQFLDTMTVWDSLDIYIQNKRMVLEIRFPFGNPSPFRFTQSTISNITTPITFPGSPPNSNLEKLKEMLDYAEWFGWSPHNKALIYGCYMHAVQDFFAGTTLIPNRFGYGYAIESDTVRHDKVLSFPELFYEMLYTPTYIPNWRFVSRDLYRAIIYLDHTHLNVHPFGSSCDFFAIHDFVEPYYYLAGWQSLPNDSWVTNPLGAFVIAAQQKGYADSSLTIARMRAYLHAWSIFLFLTYGYEWTISSTPTWEGGIYAHPNWTPDSIVNLWTKIIEDEIVPVVNVWLVGEEGLEPANYLYHIYEATILGLLGPILNILIPPIVKNIASNVFAKKISEAIKGEFFPLIFADSAAVNEQLPWPNYFETPLGFGKLNANLRETPIFTKIGEEISIWSQRALIIPPNLRSSYSDEVTLAADPCSALYKTFVDQGISSINYGNVDIWTLSRKAGLTGGMYNPEFDLYYRQPGILNAGFRKSVYMINSEIWTPITVGIEGEPVTVNFFFDLIPFGATRIRVMGITESEDTIALPPYLDDYEDGVGRWKWNFNIDLKEAAGQGVRIIFFKVFTRQKEGAEFKEMLSSYYKSVYDADSFINDNALYQSWFNSGNPFRTQDQNPFTNPTQFWPYACSLRVVPVYLNAPSQLTDEPNGVVPKVTLNWFDNSQAEQGYIIWRSVNQGSFNKHCHLNPNTITYDDTDIPTGSYNHRYFITAYYVLDNDTFYSASTDTVTISTGWVSRSSVPIAPIGITGKKVKAGGAITFDGSYVYALKGNNSREFYRIKPTSNYWQSLESIPVTYPYTNKKVKQGGALVALNGKIYAFKGNSSCEFYAFDTTTTPKTWSTKASIPWESSNKKKPVRRGGALTTLNGLIYAFKGGNTREFWMYNPGNNTWTQKANITGNKKVSWGGALTALGGKIYALKGSNTKEFWAYDVNSNQWTRKTDLPGSKKVRGGGALVTCGNRIYAFKGNLSQEFYYYDTTSNTWVSKDTIPRGVNNKRVSQGGALTAINGTIWGLKGNNTLETWRYLPTYAGGDFAGGNGGGGLPFQNEDAVIVDGVEGWRPQWSSDGEWILYFAQDSTGYERIYKIRPDGTDLTCLTSGDADRECPQFSPNDSLIIYQKFDEAIGTYRLCYIPAIGGNETVLTDGQYDCEYPRWASDGDKIVCQKSDNTEYTQLYYTTISAGDEIPLTSDGHDHEYPGYLSNNGVVVYQKQDQSDFNQIYRINSDSGAEIQLTSGSYEREYPYLSTDGNWVVYQRMSDDGFYHIYKSPMDSSSEVMLTEGNNDHENPVFSPNGQWVVFTFWTDSGTSQICKVSSEGGEITALTPDDGIRDYPKVSPDGQWIVYEKSDPDEGDGKGECGIYKTMLNSTGIAGLITPAYIFYLHPNMPNPFGSKTVIRYSLPSQAKASLIIYDITGRQIRTLLNGKVKPGIYSTTWNGKDNNGKKVASGIYFIELKSDKQRMQRKIILTH